MKKVGYQKNQLIEICRKSDKVGNQKKKSKKTEQYDVGKNKKSDKYI